MAVFDTPQPITVELDLFIGSARIIADDRAETQVEVLPRNGAKEADVKAAAQTRVEFAAGRLTIVSPKQRGYLTLGFGKDASVDVTVTLPAGSKVTATSGLGDFHCTGRLGATTLKTGKGDISLDQAATVRLNTGAGDVTVDRAEGPAEITSGVGEVRVSRIDGTAVIKNSAGGTTVGEVTGDLRLSAGSGDITVGRARLGVAAKAAAGKVQIAEVGTGPVELTSGGGALEVGVRDGASVQVDARSTAGRVHNLLGDAPSASDDTIRVRARTQFGDITIRRSLLASH